MVLFCSWTISVCLRKKEGSNWGRRGGQTENMTKKKCPCLRREKILSVCVCVSELCVCVKVQPSTLHVSVDQRTVHLSSSLFVLWCESRKCFIRSTGPISGGRRTLTHLQAIISGAFSWAPLTCYTSCSKEIQNAHFHLWHHTPLVKAATKQFWTKAQESLDIELYF